MMLQDGTATGGGRDVPPRRRISDFDDASSFRDIRLLLGFRKMPPPCPKFHLIGYESSKSGR